MVGSEKMAVFDDTAERQARAVSAQGRVEEPRFRRRSRPKGEVGRARQARAAARGVPALPRLRASRTSPVSDGAEGLRVLRVLDACQRALLNGGVGGRAAADDREEAPLPYFAHESAYVDEGAEVGAGTKIWHFSHVMKGARIGERCDHRPERQRRRRRDHRQQRQDSEQRVGLYRRRDRRRCVSRAVVRADQRHESAVAGEPALAVRDDLAQARLHDRRQRDDRLRRDGRPVCVRRRRIGRDQGRAGLRPGGRQPGAPGRLDEPARPSARRRRTPTACMRCPESGYRYKEVEPGVLRCLDLDEEAPLPAELSKGTKSYQDNSKRKRMSMNVPLLDLKAQYPPSRPRSTPRSRR